MNNNKYKLHFKWLLSAIFLISFLLLSFSNSHSQGRDRSKYRILGDTSKISLDTLKLGDTLLTKEPLDSTARIKYFTYERKDRITALFGKYKHPLLLYNSSNVEYNVSFDSLNNVTISEVFESEEIKIPVTIPFEKYIEKRTELSTRSLFYKIVAEFYKVSTEDELEKLFKNITDITIPLPFTTETIFGPPTINLKINGVIDITGSYQRTSSDQATILQETQTQNNINFKQEVQVTTKGTVGDKLTIDADWNSQRTFEFENQLKLKYKGYPDEVVQSIEAGNVSLETKSNLIGSTQALFGVKGLFKLGPLSLTTIASQKKSEKREVNITGGTQETSFRIPAWDYADNHYFLDTEYKSIFENYYSTGSSPDTAIVTDIEVWAQALPNNPYRRNGLGIVQLHPRPTGGYNDTLTSGESEIDGLRIRRLFYKLDPSEYTINKNAGYLTINVTTSSSQGDAIAVAYKTVVDGQVKQYGDFSNQVASNATLVLKIVRYDHLQSPNQRPAHATAWELKLKNIYSLGVKNIKNDPSKLQFSIRKEPPGATPLEGYTGEGPAKNKSYLNLVKLDIKRNGEPNVILPNGDGAFDFFPGTTVDLTNGEIIFPTLRPFSRTLDSAGVPLDSLERNDTIYTASKNDANNSQIKFYLVGKATGEASSRYSLGFNVVEGSVKVFNGSVELAAGVDYTIDYTTGELVIRNAGALVAGSNLKITYETNDLFQLASKTLLGTRAEFQINKTSYVGFTLLNLKQQTLNDKIRIGEEPTDNTIIGFDASTDIKANFLTKLLNNIPGYSTKDESILNLKGEIAFMLPDPNTKKSKIPSDNGEAVAYIDDFEGSKKILPLGINPLSWIISSIPKDSSIAYHQNETIRDSLMSLRRSKMDWYSIINDVPIKEVYPNRNIANNQNQSLTPFVLDIKPDSIGMFNYITQQEFRSSSSIEKNWTGIFKFLNTSTTNLIDENINFIEIWMRVGSYAGDSAKMIIDLGTISEKIITSSLFPPRGRDTSITYHTEDFDGSGTLDEGEDVGLDGYINSSELSIIPSLGPDPSRDN
ncbi:MAG: cell surface protein SprA, partial [Ignavibacteria bacterium]